MKLSGKGVCKLVVEQYMNALNFYVLQLLTPNMKNGKLYCDCCNFEFTNFYGNHFGTSCIEIHHIKPLFMYEDDDMVHTIEQCLPNLIPVCPNCHRVIHKNYIGIDSLPLFKQTIRHIHTQS